MIGILRKLGRIGVTDDLPERDIRRTVFLNSLVLALFPVFVAMTALIVAYLPATWPLLILSSVYFAGLALTLVWTHRRRYLAARIWFCGCATICTILSTAVHGAEPRMHLWLIVCIFLMFYKFPAAQRPRMYGDTAPERLREASADGFHLLHKPVSPMRLRAMLNQLLRSYERTIAPAAE
jgi:hypothetical protein